MNATVTQNAVECFALKGQMLITGHMWNTIRFMVSTPCSCITVYFKKSKKGFQEGEP